MKQYFDSSDGGNGNPGSGAYADFESGLDGWSGSNLDAGPWSTDAWSSKGDRSLQGDINMSSGDAHYLSRTGNFSFTGNELRATVRAASWGNFGSGLGVKLFVKHGNNYEWKASDWQTINAGDQIDLSLDLSGVNKSDIREYGVQFIDGNNSSGVTAVYVDNVYLWD
ncbi:hypothetical protein [Gracilibacillus kekensis]|uniref:hypothetical protein n=1 Tax=Gracilibacillus kekensis TaxID=1027249 RepID=UPI00313907FB